MKKKIFIGLGIAILILQLIRPSKNESSVISANDITKSYLMNDEVKTILQKACFDCHSNNTIYPWYTNIQPVGLIMANHVKNGKKKLDFSEFLAYTPKRQHHKLEEVIESQEESWMPIDSYLWIHDKLTSEEKKVIITWAKGIMKEIEVKNPEILTAK